MASYTIQSLSLGDLTDEVLGHISDMHVKAFINDPFTEIMVEYDPQISDLRWRAAIRATALEGELWVLLVTNERGHKEVASCAAWFPPGKSLFGTEEQRALGYNDYLSRISPATKSWLKNKYTPQVTKVFNKAFTPQDHKHLWWVSSLATHPSHQGRGYATALMQVSDHKVGGKQFGSRDFVGLAASPENVPFYRSLGFKVDGSGEVSAPKGNHLGFIILTKFRS